MTEAEIQRAMANADAGIAENRPSYVLTSSKRLKSLNRADLAEQILRQALEVFHDNPMVFRELSTTIVERDPAEGLRFADASRPRMGNHARFQRAVALNRLKRNPEAIREIEEITTTDADFSKDRFVVSKLVSLYNEEGRFDEGIRFLEPLIDAGIFTDVRMKQLLATMLAKMRRNPSKVLELLKDDVDPRSTHLKRQAADVLALDSPNLIPSPTEQRRTVAPIPSPAVQRQAKHPSEANVFLVHGQDNEAKETVARFLERLGLLVTILHEQPNRGRTIIQKFEDYSEVDFAVVLLTGDDVGGRSTSPSDLTPRARQNVILELGYFLGALGRDRVCALREEAVEVPSDFSGVLYVPYDDRGAWRLVLAREIKAADIQVDLNRVV